MFQPHSLLLLLASIGFTSTIVSARPNNSTAVRNKGCIPRFIRYDPSRLVCVCRKGECDEIDVGWPEQRGQTTLIRSSRLGRRFEAENLADVESPPIAFANASIRVRLDYERQQILGWGGSFTDAFGINLNSLPKETAELLIASYFGKRGLQYNMARVPIGGTDFSTRAYSYDDSEEEDLELRKWALAEEDLNLKIPHVKRAMELVQERGEQLKLFATPWSAPGWMKTGKSLQCGHLIDTDAVYTSYTNYLMKFYAAYEQHGIKFWGAIVQNDPVSSFDQSCQHNEMPFYNYEMSKLIGNYLGPAIRARGWNKDNFKLMVGGDSIGFINYQVPSLLNNKDVLEYVSGLAFYWYSSVSGLISYTDLHNLYIEFADRIEFMIMGEASVMDIFQPAIDNSVQEYEKIGNWTRAEMYASDIIEDLNRHTAAWVDWNMALDMDGGPNWANNFVDSPIKVDAEKGEFYKQPMYYALAHFSRLFPPGSVVLETKVDDTYEGVMAVAAHNKQSGHLVVNILNKSSDPKTMHVRLGGAKEATRITRVKPFLVEANSISSLVIKL